MARIGTSSFAAPLDHIHPLPDGYYSTPEGEPLLLYAEIRRPSNTSHYYGKPVSIVVEGGLIKELTIGSEVDLYNIAEYA